MQMPPRHPRGWRSGARTKICATGIRPGAHTRSRRPRPRPRSSWSAASAYGTSTGSKTDAVRLRYYSGSTVVLRLQHRPARDPEPFGVSGGRIRHAPGTGPPARGPGSSWNDPGPGNGRIRVACLGGVSGGVGRRRHARSQRQPLPTKLSSPGLWCASRSGATRRLLHESLCTPLCYLPQSQVANRANR